MIYMMNNCLAGIVTYNPEIERLEESLNRIVPQVDKVVIIDNGSKNISVIYDLLKTFPDVLIEANGENKGIACALNQIGDKAEELGKEFFMSLDQDSVVDEGMADKLLKLFEDEKVGGASPYINVDQDFVPKDKTEEFKTVISSGFIVRTSVWKEIGGYWEYLFIDEVDHEFCFQLGRHGYKILRSYNTSLLHCIGETATKKVLGHTFTPTNHSAFRRYYISRNNVIMGHLYPDEAEAFAHRNMMLFRIKLSILMCESDKFNKIRAIDRGIRDGRKWCKENSAINERRISK